MNNQDSDIETREDIELGEALERLESNPDFKLVIADSYIKSISEDLSGLLDPDEDQETVAKLSGVARLIKHLEQIKTNAELAKILEDEEGN